MYILVEKATGHILSVNERFMLEELAAADGFTDATHGIYPLDDTEVDQVVEAHKHSLLEFKDGNLTPSVEGHENKARNDRMNKLMGEVDTTVSNPLRWAAMPAEEQTAWAEYRTALLDITEQPGFPLDITWPTKP